MPLNNNTLHRITRRGVAEIIVEEEFVKLLQSRSRPQSGSGLRLKMGFDPSRPDIHLGHVVGLRKLRQLQELGHQVILIVGDWTAQIGDPSGQSATRPMLTAEEVRANAETYMRQFFKVVDKEKTQAVWQSEWFGRFTLADVLRLTSRFTVSQILHRDDFWKRWEASRPIAVTELLYPLLQAYDSVMVQADVEFGGTDQKFNLLVGRELQQMMGQRPQQCFLVPILVGTDGVQKMSKSLNNYIAVDEPPNDMYGKVMSLPDSQIIPYFELLTDVPDEELSQMKSTMERSEINPMTLKKRLALDIVKQFHGEMAANESDDWFQETFQKRLMPHVIPELRVSFKELQLKALSRKIPGATVRLTQLSPPRINIFNYAKSNQTSNQTTLVKITVSGTLVLLGLVPSRSEAKRLVAQDAVEVNGQACAEGWGIGHGDVIRIGKTRFYRIVNTDPANTL